MTNAAAPLTLRVNQETPGNAWTLLASDVLFNAGSGGYVELMNNTGDTEVVQGDAVKFVFKSLAGDTEPPSVPANLMAPTITTSSIQLAWKASSDNVGVTGYKVYRDGSFLANAPTNSFFDNGLAANTSYSYQVSAYDAVPNESARSVAVARTTLSVPPDASSIAASSGTVCSGDSITWTAVTGFGAGKVAYYRYAWNQAPTYTFTGSEPQWSSGTLSTSPTAGGTWYLHVRGYNSAGAANGTYDYAITSGAGIAPDLNGDCAVDQLDMQIFRACMTGEGVAYDPDDLAAGCTLTHDGGNFIGADFNRDGDVDQSDFGVLQRCISGAEPVDPNCVN